MNVKKEQLERTEASPANETLLLASLDRALVQCKEGNVVPHEQVRKKV